MFFPGSGASTGRAPAAPTQISCAQAVRAGVAIAAALALAGPAAAQNAAAPAPAANRLDMKNLPAPDIANAPKSLDGDAIRYGYELISRTYAHIGPEVADASMRYSGNNMACQNCHLQAGLQAGSMPFVGVWGTFPQYRGRENAVSTLEDRINGCMERSMNGRKLALDSREMVAMLAYMKWTSAGVPVGAEVVGQGTFAIKAPDRAADLQHGGKVFVEQCAACHGENGLGVRNGKVGDANGYQFPPLWGPDSYNDGAGMNRLLTAAAFVRSNMPFGATHDAAVLSDEDAYDVAAFVNSHSRPAKANLEKDYPDLTKKPVDAPYPPWLGAFDAAQHKAGPYAPIRAFMKTQAK